METAAQLSHDQLVRRGRWLNYITLAYNSLEGVIAITGGFLAASVALVGFGVDSVIELSAGLVALWRLRAETTPGSSAQAERLSHRLIGGSFLGLAAYVVLDAGRSLFYGEAPAESPAGILIAAASLVTMPVLARAKRRVALDLGSRALAAEATQTLLCTYLSAILLAGLGLHALLGWWWADPVAALSMVPFIVREGMEGVSGRDPCGDGCVPL